MRYLQTQLLVTAFASLVVTTAQAACSDSEYSRYKEYDAALEAYPSISDSDLREVFAKKFGMKPAALKDLYFRCTHQWVEQNPKESLANLKKSKEDFAKDCAKRPANDPYCKAGLGK